MPQFYTLTTDAKAVHLKLNGRWVVDQVEAVAQEIRPVLNERKRQEAVIHCADLSTMDLSGAWMLRKITRAWEKQGMTVTYQGFGREHEHFLEQIANITIQPVPAPKRLSMQEFIAAAFTRFVNETNQFLYLAVQVAGTFAGNIRHPGRFRFPSIVRHLEDTAVLAVPIVTLMAAMIAIVLTYQGATQLKQFGMEVYTAELVGISVLREMGVLLTAIMVAGRSGSAFAAELGVMKLNQEVDALQTMGCDPVEVLVVPRLIALVIALPLLTMIANLAGLFCADLMAPAVLGMEMEQFAMRVAEKVPTRHLWLGLIKAPVFAVLIALIACYRGFQVENSAEQVGKKTTRAVVEAIFLVMAADAIFSVIYSEMNL